MKILLGLIVLIALILRFYGIDWDQGFHMHPDERMLILVAEKIHFWDNLNPSFFNYGSLPIYLLKGSSQLIDLLAGTSYANYNGMLYVGRFLSVVFDVGTLLVVYLMAQLLTRNTTAALFAAGLYSISFFPIQNSHFFVVDVFLTFFLTSTIYLLLRYVQKPGLLRATAISIPFAAALATKVTAILFIPIILGILLVGFYVAESNHSFLKKLRPGVYSIVLFVFFTLLLYFIFMPYAFVSFNTFISETSLQAQMGKNPYIFPYTLQYVYTLPYLYFIKNIFIWGLGPVISILALFGIDSALRKTSTKRATDLTEHKNHLFKRLWGFAKDYKVQVVFALCYIFYFLILGISAVKFMRYMLPIYPFFIILAGYGLYLIRKESKIVFLLFVCLALVWTFSFLHIYSVEHTRLAATKWILTEVPPYSTLAVEHWDDRLPVTGSENYQFVEMNLYDLPDDSTKWDVLNEKLARTDYIILASNRLYTPLQILSDCKKYAKCYHLTARYYEQLFKERLGFKKIKEFSANPRIPFLNIEFSDQSADESFTVYDHPKVIIFKKI